MVKLRYFCCVLLFFAVSQSALAYAFLDKNFEKYEPNKYAIIFGTIDMTAEDSFLAGVSIKKYLPSDTSTKQSSTWVRDWYRTGKDCFVAIVEPGQYYLSDFRAQKNNMGTFSRQGTTVYNLHSASVSENKAHLITVQAGDIMYWGSVSCKQSEQKGRSGASFVIEPMASPNEKETLTEILYYAKGTAWETIINQRIKRIPTKEPIKFPKESMI